MWISLAFIGAAGLFFGIRWIIKKRQDGKIGRDNTAIPRPTAFDPAKITDALKEDIYSYGTRNSQAYQDALNLSNQNLIKVYEDYQARYSQLDNESLTQAIEGEYSIWGSASIPMKLLVQKLKGLGLN